jgi:hypothetical protein
MKAFTTAVSWIEIVMYMGSTYQSRQLEYYTLNWKSIFNYNLMKQVHCAMVTV